jgi:type I restriction enzyme M protein
MSHPTALVQKLWNYCHISRDDGSSYGHNAEQLTFLLFLKTGGDQSRQQVTKLSLSRGPI